MTQSRAGVDYTIRDTEVGTLDFCGVWYLQAAVSSTAPVEAKAEKGKPEAQEAAAEHSRDKKKDPDRDKKEASAKSDKASKKDGKIVKEDKAASKLKVWSSQLLIREVNPCRRNSGAVQGILFVACSYFPDKQLPGAV